MKLLESVLWISGVTLLLFYVGAHAWGLSEQRNGVSAFHEAQRLVRADRAPIEPSVVAVLRIPGIELEVPVNYGTAEPVLRRGAGLVKGSAAPGSHGNVAIAAHRDTYFRGLKDVALGDLIELEILDRTLTYRVTELSVVEPTDVRVLADTGEPVLTLVTCYPFYFVGHAPQRYIVRAVQAEVST